MSTVPRRRPSKITIRDAGQRAPAIVHVPEEADAKEGDSKGEGRHTERYTRLQAILKPIPLLALGVYFAAMILGGNLQNYVSPQLAWLAWIASILFICLGLASAFHVFKSLANGPSSWPGRGTRATTHRETGERHEEQSVGRQDGESHGNVEHQGFHDHDQRHFHRIPWTGLLVATLPLILALIVPSRPLGAAALRGRGAPVDFVRGYTTLPQTDTTEWNMLEWQRAFYSGVKPPSWFEGQKATVTGFIVEEPGAPAGHFVMARWVMRHCAADAYGMGLLASGQGADGLPSDTWVRVKGKMGVIKIGSDDALVLNAESVDSTIGQPVPAYIFLYWNPPGAN